ncbi:class I histocompatibility antigen, F10 alpha chain-like [Micropterus dolomieu]|uniref:class I histocompatibility antigen, F10 alpha chain-like n=1 Tax=Micropterus dolomieu TaxID=147949 RepID=UPI001E8E5261|nr:class I histocompatibility antigen, F10 alpha chain-like [Micropterus dolomieu]XP_045899675.1 class I histocompatibility antigen, F10 alpha chain-like [Micropterus dolomieu]
MRQVTMKTLVFLALLEVCIHCAAAVTHSLKYFYTASSGVPNFPEFVTVGLVDEVQISHYDSITMRAVTKQDWMSRVTADDPQYWERQTQGLNDTKELFKGNIEIAKLRFNQTGGFHIYQNMYGCEWDDETEEVRGYDQHGYDGEDFIVFDLKTETWTAPTPQAFITKQKVEHDKALIAYDKNYLTKECVDWLKKYVDYRRSFLLRKDPLSVSLLQKTPSSPVSCHATGFYFEAGGLLSTCDRAKMFWRKDGEELHEDVDQGDILPNNDGSFQMSVDLNPPTGDWEKYECVFQLAGVKNDIVTKLEKPKIRTNGGNPSDMTVIIVIVAVVVLALVAIAVIGYFIYKKNKAKRPPSPVSNPEVLEELNPKA